jgi:hypothetical protein
MRYQERLALARAEAGFPDGDEVTGLFDFFALANARIRGEHFPYIVVHTASVGAYFPGRLSPRMGG